MSTVTIVDAGPLRSEDQTLRELPLTAVQLRIADAARGAAVRVVIAEASVLLRAGTVLEGARLHSASLGFWHEHGIGG